MKKPKLKKPSRKFVLIEVETTLSNATLAAQMAESIWQGIGNDAIVFQVHVNAAKKEKTK